MIPGYLDNRRQELDRLKELLMQGDLIEIKKIGHKLAGNAGSYGFDELSVIGAKMEEAINIHDIDHLLNEYESVLNSYQIS